MNGDVKKMNNITRTVPSLSELDKLVTDVIENNRATKSDFSAYEITQELRTANSSLEITHGEVRHLVHDKMQGDADYIDDHRTDASGRPYIMYMYVVGGVMPAPAPLSMSAASQAVSIPPTNVMPPQSPNPLQQIISTVGKKISGL